MVFAPHILQLKRTTPLQRDEFGRPIPGSSTEEWIELCRCRCDDNTTKEFRSENGQVYRPTYHVVCEGHLSINTGDEVRCIDGENVRGEGIVYVPKKTNFFNYTEIWI